MLIYTAKSFQDSRVFSDKTAAFCWTEQNASYSPRDGAYWKQNSKESWVLVVQSSGNQVGIVYETPLHTLGETDPLRVLAFKILEGDPQALDFARDVLKL
jgi:hypothetical protein